MAIEGYGEALKEALMILDRDGCEMRLRMAGLGAADSEKIRKIAPFVRGHVPRIIDAFYEHVTKIPLLKEIITRRSSVERLKSTFRRYLEEILVGTFDEAYCRNRVRIGIVHHRIELSLMWYIGMFNHFRQELFAVVDEVSPASGMSADEVKGCLDRVITLDTLLAVDAYVGADTLRLRHEADRAMAAARAKSNFLNTMSHELRTPMNSILGFTEIVISKSPELAPRMRQHLETVHRNAQHLLALINDILDLAKADSGRLTVKQEEGLLQPLFDDMTRTLESLVGSKPLKIKLLYDKLPREPMRLDFGKARQIILNLVSNAAKYTDEGAVTLRANLQGPFLVVQVIDTGIGIPESELVAIFDEFHQVDSSRAGRRGGTGLGLALTNRLLILLGGSIHVESHVGRGSTFTVRIPCERT